MTRIVLVYGSIAGIILVLCFNLSLALGADHGWVGMAVGYLSMLIALSLVFVGVRKYRDEHLGGIIRFGTALVMGFAISAVASLFYVLGWEAYLFATDYRFMSDYAASTIAAQRAAGASAAQLAQMQREFDAFAVTYANPLWRALITLTEIAPVALIVTVLSAALLRRSDFMPTRTPAR